MRSQVLSIFVILAIVAGAYGQDSEPLAKYDFQINIVDQPDSPLRLSVDTRLTKAFLPNNISLKLTNVSDKPIIAYSMLTDGERYQNVHVNPRTKPIQPSEGFNRGFGTAKQTHASYSIDYVLYADGTSWGADRYERSKQIALYFQGRTAALELLKRLVALYRNPQDFINQAYTFGGYLSADPAGPPNPATMGVQIRRGWEHIIWRLRAFEKRSEEAAELADKLEREIPR